MISQLLENVRLAGTTGTPTCQDTGMAVVFARLGSRVLLSGGTLREAVDAGVRAAYTELPLRKSVVDYLFRRANTRDNTPAILHVEAEAISPRTPSSCPCCPRVSGPRT